MLRPLRVPASFFLPGLLGAREACCLKAMRTPYSSCSSSAEGCGFVENFSGSMPVCSQNSTKNRMSPRYVVIEEGAGALAMSSCFSSPSTAR